MTGEAPFVFLKIFRHGGLFGSSNLDETVGASLRGRPNRAEKGAPTEGRPYIILGHARLL